MSSRPEARRRVLFCIYSHNAWGGIESWITGLYRHLSRRGWDLRMGLARGARYNDPAAFRKAHPGIETIEFDGRTGTVEGRNRAILKAVDEYDPSVMVPVGLGNAFLAASNLKREGRPIRVVAPVRATSAEILNDLAGFAPMIDMCVGNNPLHARYLESTGRTPRDRLKTIVNGVDLPAIDPRREDSGSPLRLLFVGRLHQLHKRILDLPLLVEELERRRVAYCLTVVGDGENKAALEERLDATGRTADISFAGYVDPSVIGAEVYPRHDVLIHFSASEGCPQTVQQCMAHGVVPVCSEFLGFHSLGFLRSEETCLSFPVGDIPLAGAHIERLASDRRLLGRLSESGKNAMRSLPMSGALAAWESAIEDVLHMEIRGLEAGQAIALEPAGGSRLERLGIPPRTADRLRHALRRFPDLGDGWAEWPGTVCALEARERSDILAELARLEDEARRTRMNTIART